MLSDLRDLLCKNLLRVLSNILQKSRHKWHLASRLCKSEGVLVKGADFRNSDLHGAVLPNLSVF